jgi:uncharacterized membrane protein
MKRRLPLLLLFVALAADAKRPPPKANPPPPPVEEIVEEEEGALPTEEPTQDELPPDELFAEEPPEPRTRSPDGIDPDPLEGLTDEQAGAIAIGSMCCCLLVLLSLVGLIIWLVKRGSGAKKAVASNFPSQNLGAPAPRPPAGMQLSIFALALEPQAREIVEQQLSQLGISPVPTTPQTRGRLVREAARALLTVQPSWRQFGYGEKPAITDLASAESAYRAASEDFRSRAVTAGATATGTHGLVVVTLLICCRRALLGVTRLDDPLAVRSVLEDRLRVSDDELLGAELLWAPAAPGGRVTEAEIGLRFPEMLPLPRTAN